MHTISVNETIEEELLYEEPERTSDIQLSPTMNTLLIVIWSVIFLAGLAVIYLVKNPLAGALIIAVPTFIGMVIKPTFALCMMMLVLPTGAGVAYQQAFSLDRGVGIALAVSFLLNLMVSRPQLRIQNKALWAAVIYTIWILFISPASPYLGLELRRAFTQFQLLTLIFIVYWILQTNSEKTFLWGLKAYVIGTLGTIMMAYMSGTAINAKATERYAATLGQAIDPNMLAALVSIAFLAAIYLFARDKNIFWRLIYTAAIISMPIMLLKIASRGAIIALTFTMLSPLLFLRQVLRRPALAALLFLAIIFASGSAAIFAKKHSLEGDVSERLTDVQRAKESVGYRLSLIYKAIEAATKWPTGTSYNGWFQRADARHYPHNDFFLVLGVYGIPGAAIFTFFILIMILTVKRMPLGVEKLYVRAVLTFLLVMGLNIGQVYAKYFWIFLAFVLASERIAKLHTATSDSDTLIQYEEVPLTQYELV